MEYNSEPRKIIKFGNSSYIISLPKQWIRDNKLKKGDIVFLTKNSEQDITLSPKEKKQEIESKKMIIEINKMSPNEIQKRIGSAYINNYSEIILKGGINKSVISNVLKNAERIGLEVVEQSPTEVIIKDFLNMEELSIKTTMRRMDNTLRAMFEDLKEGLQKKTFGKLISKEMMDSDQRVNKMYFLIWKVSKKGEEWPSILSKIGMSHSELSDTRWIALHLEFIGDEIKRTARILESLSLDDEERKGFLGLIEDLEKNYIKSVTSYHQHDVNLAIEANLEKEELIKRCEKFIEKIKTKKAVFIIEKLKTIVISSNYISKTVAY